MNLISIPTLHSASKQRFISIYINYIEIYSFHSIKIEIIYYTVKRIKKVIKRAKSPVASVTANPSIAYVNSCFSWNGFLAIADIREEKIVPTPIPTPRSAIVEIPAPIAFAGRRRLFMFF